MREITITNETKTTHILVKDIKYIIGNNIQDKDTLLSTIHHLLKFNKHSQFDIEQGNDIDIRINNSKVSKPTISHYFYSQSWSIEKDMKLASESVTKDYLLSNLPTIELSDDLKLINQMLDVFNDTYFSDIYINDETKMKFSLSSLVGPVLMKLIESHIDTDNLKKNDRNLNIYERLRVFLTLVKNIALKNTHKLIITTLHIPVVDTRIHNLLKQATTPNLVTLIFSDILTAPIHYEDVLIINSNTIDLYSETDLYNLILDKGLSTSIEDCRHILQQKFNLDANTFAYNTQLIDFINTL